jgi:glycerol-1-phosphatase
MVAALRAATAREPQVAGKPEPTLMRDALSRGRFRTPLVVGNRLDTYIAGANAAGLPSLLVLCGVSTADETVHAPVGRRPDYIAADLRSLDGSTDCLRVAPHPAWKIDIDPAAVTVHATGHNPGDSLSSPAPLPTRCGAPASTPIRFPSAPVTTQPARRCSDGR